MSIKQISFSPELLDTPEVNPINIDDMSAGGSCELTSDADLTQLDFTSTAQSHYPSELLGPNPSLLTQIGGGLSKPEPNTQPMVGGFGVDLEANKINLNNMPTQPAIRLSSQSGGDVIDMDNFEDETNIEELGYNQDNPGEDPPQMDDMIDENDDAYKDDNLSLTEKLKELRNVQEEMNIDENQQIIKELENTKIADLDFDLSLLSKKLEYEMDLFWDKKLDIAFIENKIEEYIGNYESKDYETYRKMLMYILTKTKMGFKLTINKSGEHILHKGDETKFEIKLTPPKYINLDKATLDLKQEIKDITFQLYDLKSELVENAEKIMDEDTSKFRKLQKTYYDLIHKKAIFEGYFKKINKRGDDEVEMFLNFIKRNSNFRNDSTYIIDTQYIKVPLSFNNDLTQTKMSSLELFNQIRNKFEQHIGTKTKFTKIEQNEIKELIKKYVQVGNAAKVVGMIEQFNIKQKKSINYIVEKKPIINVSNKNDKKSKKNINKKDKDTA